MTVEQRLNELETALQTVVHRQRKLITAMILAVVGLVSVAAAPQNRNAEVNFVDCTGVSNCG